MRWSVGVTTVPKRRHDLLPRTLASLQAAGFGPPRLFVDGDSSPESWREEFGLEVTARWPLVRTCANAHMALLEMFLRDPDAERYALFQDDVVVPLGLRAYLETWYPTKGYQNLFTFNSNVQHLLKTYGLHDARKIARGWHVSHQFGRGALGLVFDAEAIRMLLSSWHMIQRQENKLRRWRQFDGAVVMSMQEKGWREFVHYPSLSLHTGLVSCMEKRKPIEDHDPNHPLYTWPDHNPDHFPGETFDCREWTT